jgi:hypothetical protein
MALPRRPSTTIRPNPLNIQSLNARVAHLESQVQEKHHDIELISVDSAYDAVYILTVNDPDQGDSDTERIGDRIRMHSFSGRMEARQDGSPATVVRFMIIHDFNNTITSAADIFEGYSGNYATPFQMTVWDHQNSFRVLYDILLPIRSWDETSVGRVNISKLFNFSVRANITTRFDNGSTTITHGAVKIIITSNCPDSGAKPGVTGFMRLVYVDN